MFKTFKLSDRLIPSFILLATAANPVSFRAKGAKSFFCREVQNLSLGSR